MGDWPILSGMGIKDTGSVDLANTWYTSCTTGSANTKGNWLQLIAATSFKASGLLVVSSYAAHSYDYLFDIGTGAEGSETVIISNLIYGGLPDNNWLMGATYFPIEIPKGTRVAARAQCTGASQYSAIAVMPIAGGFTYPSGCTVVDTYGAATADSGGVSIDPGGTAHTKGAYSQITAATTRACRGIIVGIGNQVNGNRNSVVWLMDVAIGGAGSELVIVPNFPLACEGMPQAILPLWTPFIPVDIPAGTRIAIRAQGSITDAADRLFDAVVYCIG